MKVDVGNQQCLHAMIQEYLFIWTCHLLLCYKGHLPIVEEMHAEAQRQTAPSALVARV